MKFAKELACLFVTQNVFFLSQDNKASVPLNIPVSKKQTATLMQLECKVLLPDYDLAIEERHKVIPLLYAACCIKDDEL